MTKTYLITESNLIGKIYKVKAISEEEAINNFDRYEAEYQSLGVNPLYIDFH